MRGVLGILLIAIGFIGIYKVLTGKAIFPVSTETTNSTKGDMLGRVKGDVGISPYSSIRRLSISNGGMR